jgi:hypothetical protein
MGPHTRSSTGSARSSCTDLSRGWGRSRVDHSAGGRVCELHHRGKRVGGRRDAGDSMGRAPLGTDRASFVTSVRWPRGGGLDQRSMRSLEPPTPATALRNVLRTARKPRQNLRARGPPPAPVQPSPTMMLFAAPRRAAPAAFGIPANRRQRHAVHQRGPRATSRSGRARRPARPSRRRPEQGRGQRGAPERRQAEHASAAKAAGEASRCATTSTNPRARGRSPVAAHAQGAGARGRSPLAAQAQGAGGRRPGRQ